MTPGSSIDSAQDEPQAAHRRPQAGQPVWRETVLVKPLHSPIRPAFPTIEQIAEEAETPFLKGSAMESNLELNCTNNSEGLQAGLTDHKYGSIRTTEKRQYSPLARSKGRSQRLSAMELDDACFQSAEVPVPDRRGANTQPMNAFSKQEPEGRAFFHGTPGAKEKSGHPKGGQNRY